MKRITTKYKRRQKDVVTTAKRVIEGFQNNPSFTNPPAALAALILLLPEYIDALAKAEGRDQYMVSIKNDKKAAMLSLLEELMQYVMTIAKGDGTIMLSSGFAVTGEARINTQLVIEGVEVKTGQSGEITIRAKNVTGAKAYIHQYTTEPPAPNSNWIWEGSSLNRHTFKGLTPEKRHWFRIVAIGNSGQQAFSPVVSKIIE